MARAARPPAPAPPTAAPAGPAPPGPVAARWNASGPFATGGGVILGILAVTLFVQYARGGGAEVKAWLNAKFLNNEVAGGAVGSTIGKGAQLLGGIYGGGGGGKSGLSGGAGPASPKAPGGPAKAAL